MMQLSIIIPTLNEADNIEPLFERLLEAFADQPWSMEILLADGGSTDGTLDRAKLWQERGGTGGTGGGGGGRFGLSRPIPAHWPVMC